MQAIWFGWLWAVTGGSPFSYTCTVSGLGGQDVMAESAIAKIDQQWGDPRHVKTAVWAATFYSTSGTSAVSTNWGIDGAPVRYIPKCLYLTFMLEVERSFGAMVGKVYV